MNIRDIFKKDINRIIKGVIKIGQNEEDVAKQELSEYVVTRAIREHFDDFFGVIKKSFERDTDDIGVWISGFFGSGKSHLLKIFAYILQNKKAGELTAVDYFKDKIEDPSLIGNMEMASRLDSDVLIFNIDSLADVNVRNQKDPIVTVMNKVFDNHLGYHGQLPWLSSLERELDMNGSYVPFKKYYGEKFGVSWEEDRRKVFFKKDQVIEALEKTTDYRVDNPDTFLSDLKEEHSLTVASFAQKINEYIEKKGKNHRVIFMIDEVGQYVGDDLALMLNLQTVAEDLGKFCGGRAWLVVTSQMAIDKVVKVRGDMFSKISGRFKLKLNMASTGVDEVIKKRILDKNEENGAADTLRQLFLVKESVIKNLLTFTNGTPEYAKYKDADDFATVYPFVPYQFQLLQEMFNAIRTNGASGKSLAEGERSLLSAFQESAQAYGDAEIGALVPFYTFYETIDAFLDHDIRIVVSRAKKNEALNEFDIKVLKLLFLIKYLRDKMPANLDNISVLMADNIDQDKAALMNDVQESLTKLKKQILIQQDGDVYTFLTNAEQDVNNEIRNIHVEFEKTRRAVCESLFNDVLKGENRISYEKHHLFQYNKKFDDDFYGPQKGELTLHVVSPAGGSFEEDERDRLKTLSAVGDTIVLRLPDYSEYFDEMEEALQIEAYIRRNNGKSIPEVEAIKSRKMEEAKERRSRAVELIRDAARSGNLYVCGAARSVNSQNPSARIEEALVKSIESVYTKIGDINPCIFVKADLGKVLAGNPQTGIGEVLEGPGFGEIALHIENMAAMNQTVTIKSLQEKYAKPPYHWRPEDVKGVVLSLFKENRIELVNGGKLLDKSERDQIVNLVWKDGNADSIKIRKRILIGQDMLRKIKTLSEDIFNKKLFPMEEEDLSAAIRESIKRALYSGDNSIREILGEYRDTEYPGESVMKEGESLFKELEETRSNQELFETMLSRKKELEDYSYDSEPVIRFFSSQRKHFDEALEQIAYYQKSKEFVSDEETISIVNEMKEIVESAEPYGDIHKLPELRKRFIEAFTEVLEKESEVVLEAIESNRNSTGQYLEKVELPETDNKRLSEKIRIKFDGLKDELKHAGDLQEIFFKKEKASKVKETLVEEIEKLFEALMPEPETDKPPKPKKKTVKINLTQMGHGLRDIETEEDLNEVVEAFRTMLKEKMAEGTVIKLY